MGFNLDESNMPLGVIVASKSRDATEAGQIAGAMFMTFMFGANAASYDKVQKIRASLVTKPASSNSPIEVDIKTKSGKQIKFDQQIEMPIGEILRLIETSDLMVIHRF